MREDLIHLLEPPVEELGFELVDIEYVPGRGAVLRVFIDRREARGKSSAAGSGISGGPEVEGSDLSGRVTVDDCARVSRAVSETLEIEDPIKGHYTLEISSPGFDRILRKREHFERFVGEQIVVELRVPMDGRRRFSGLLKTLLDDTIVVEVDGRIFELALERIQRARLRA